MRRPGGLDRTVSRTSFPRRALCRAGLLLPLAVAAPAVAFPLTRPLKRRKVLRREVVTADGAVIVLYRYMPPGGGKTRGAVLLVPELGMGREAFDLDGVGLAPWLQDRGFDVFVLEPRGHVESATAPAWTLDTLVTTDLVTAMGVIANEHPGEVDLVLHGYSGALALASSTRELKGRVGRVVALSTPALVEVPNRFAEEVLSRGAPLSTLAMDPEGAAIFDLLFARHSKIPARRLRALRLEGFTDLGRPAAEGLLRWMRTGDLALPGSSFKARLEEYDRPTLQLIALRNNWVHPEHTTPLRELAPKAAIRLRVLSILHFLTEDYTHLSLLHGAAAPRELFPLIEAFLKTGEPAMSGSEATR